MNSNINYLQGAKLGDFIHSLCICKYLWETTGAKANLYIGNYGDKWEKGVEYTFQDLKPILLKQPWVNTFNLYDDSVKIDVNLVLFRRSRLLFQTNWLEIFFMDFLNIKNPPKEYKWIELEKDNNFADTVLVNRSLQPMSNNLTKIYDDILSKHEKVSFICFDEKQYNNWSLKNKYPVIYAESLYDFFIKINSCKLLLSNQSGPAAWATAMNVPRITELFMRADHNHYIKDKNYYQNFDYFIGDVW